MSISTTALNRAAAVSGAAGGLLFLAVQIGHPVVDAAYTTTPEFVIRQSVKVAFTVLSLVGITGVYLRQVKQIGLLGLIGYILLSAAFLTMMCIEVLVMVVLPPLAHTATAYVNDVIAVALQGNATGDIGLFTALNTLAGLMLVVGGVVFGIASFRARVLMRWPAALLAAGVVATLAIRVLPQVNERLFAVPIGVALAGLGVSLWIKAQTAAAQPTSADSPTLASAGAK